MGKRLVVFVLAASMTLLFAAVSASGDEEPPPQLPPHSHMLLINVDMSDFSYDKCVDLAGKRGAVPLHAHHDRLHFGSSGVSGAFFDGASDNVVIPSEGLTPWKNCEAFGKIFPPNE